MDEAPPLPPADQVRRVSWRGGPFRPRLVLHGPGTRRAVRAGPLTGPRHEELSDLVGAAERAGARVDPVAVGFLGYRDVTVEEMRRVSRRVLRRVVVGYAATAALVVAAFVLAAGR